MYNLPVSSLKKVKVISPTLHRVIHLLASTEGLCFSLENDVINAGLDYDIDQLALETMYGDDQRYKRWNSYGFKYCNTTFLDGGTVIITTNCSAISLTVSEWVLAFLPKIKLGFKSDNKYNHDRLNNLLNSVTQYTKCLSMQFTPDYITVYTTKGASTVSIQQGTEMTYVNIKGTGTSIDIKA